MAKRVYPYYVVWEGRSPGIYQSWEETLKQVHAFPGAKYKGFRSLDEAQKAFEKGHQYYVVSHNKSNEEQKKSEQQHVEEKPEIPSLCVDASCEGNPGRLEYRGVYTDSGEEVFRVGPFPLGTNNVGEFLAIVHALAWLEKNNLSLPIYSDSSIAIRWVQHKKCPTLLEHNEQTDKLLQLVDRALAWLAENPGPFDVRKWQTHLWGEIPADFGKK